MGAASSSRPAPLTSADCNLQGLDYMPLHGTALFGSTFYCAATDAEFRAGFTLWWAAWNQVPAGSLPNDEAALCRLAGLGRDLKAWSEVRARALHGFALCSDGRLYHEFLCRQVLVAWEKRSKARTRKAAWRAGAKGTGNAPVPRDKTGTDAGRPRPVPDERKGRDEVRPSDGLSSGLSRPEPAGPQPTGQAPKDGRPSLAAVVANAAHAAQVKTKTEQPLSRVDSARPAADWRFSAAGIIAKGLEMGLPPFDLAIAEGEPSELWKNHMLLVLNADADAASRARQSAKRSGASR